MSAAEDRVDGPPVADLLERAVAALGGRRRDGQLAMAEAVAAAIDSGEHLLVQAGTGTGKSLGYLVPAVRHAVLAGERVIVSTATLALQRQVMTRDLPLVATAVAPALPRTPQVALLKGWHNYLCLHKVAGGYPDEEPALFDLLPTDRAGDHPAPGGTGADRPGDLGAQVLRLREWAEETTSGDRDDLEPGVTDRAWRQVSVTAMECLGSSCPLVEDCFPERARALAREADVVVTNHAMLGIAAGGSPGVLPEHDVLVVDEAHELSDRVTAQATVELSGPSVEQAARTARRHGRVPTDDLETAARDLAAVLVELPEGRFPTGLPEGVAIAVAAVRDAARALLTTLRPEPGTSTPTAEGGLKMASSAVLTVLEIADRMTGDAASDGRDVVWCARGEAFGRGAAPRLHAAPLAVSGLVRTNLLAGRRAVLTSATLELGGSFDPLARAVGLDPAHRREEGDDGGDRAGADDLPWRGLDVGSPFEYPRSGILYVARHLPPPGRDGSSPAQLDEIAALVEAAGGATLGLFSSRRAAVAAAEAMRDRLDVPVLCQGDDQLPTLVRRFAEDDATCLFGTLSLWQGVDVPGPSCRLVLVDRIPFPRPDDPVRAARTESVERAGGNGFMAVSATHAALLLAQGAGRLVRTDEDRGVVAVLDPRLVTARYGSFLLRSMPPFWRTTDPAVARAALARLAAASRGRADAAGAPAVG
ncbi:ATP-dependent DNA helicase [Cellulomonas carbonis]|uniref:ATP-dependent helicase DinG n=1 Tax=Cellulomonas carbonis T26 TaxID=947969 RepID=A0A0A0BVY5_9CELL|nr:ATP-dependent DNA helicase [Cellulomonas carbonis]KGM12135.1 ATP-dependent helicase [Cellulomonas carbonis T26]